MIYPYKVLMMRYPKIQDFVRDARDKFTPSMVLMVLTYSGYDV